MEAGPVRGYATSIRGTVKIDDIAGSDVIIVAAGINRKPGQQREDVYRENAPIVRAIAQDIRRLAPGALVINIVEPIDLLTLLVQETIGADRFKVMGVGGLLTSTRIRYLVSKALGVSPREVTGLIIGPHHPSMVFLRDTIRVSGIPAEALLGEARLSELIEEARNAGDTILQLAQRSSAFYASCAAAAALVEAIVGDTKALLPVSVRCEGEYGLKGLAIGVPAYVGEQGVTGILQLKLAVSDREAFDKAAAELKTAHDNIAAGAA
jgi:malate dehydrogenase